MASLVAALRELARRTPADKAGLAALENDTLLLRRHIQHTPVFGDVPETVWHFLDDADIRFKDRDYAALQLADLERCLSRMESGAAPDAPDEDTGPSRPGSAGESTISPRERTCRRVAAWVFLLSALYVLWRLPDYLDQAWQAFFILSPTGPGVVVSLLWLIVPLMQPFLLAALGFGIAWWYTRPRTGDAGD
jgi:hypothetical protein